MLFEKIHLEDDEEVIKVVRKHWFIIVAELFGVVLMTFIPFLVLVVFVVFPEMVQIKNMSASHVIPLFTFFTSLWLILSIMMGYMIWTHYYLDLWVITNKRIIMIDQLHFFNRTVSSFRLERLQDLKVSINGIIGTFLNFGSIRAQTASTAENNFAMNGLPDPRGLLSLMQKLADNRTFTARE